MKAAGAAILGAAVVGAGLLIATNSNAAEPAPDNEVDFDVDAELQLASNYYANALTDPFAWSDGQLKSLEGMLIELGMTREAGVMRDMRIGLYGDTNAPPEPLPEVSFIPTHVIEAIADKNEADVAAEEAENNQ